MAQPEQIMPEQTIAIIVAGGTAQRLKDGDNTPKQYRNLTGGKTVLAQTLQNFIQHSGIDKILCVIHKDHEDLYQRAIAPLPKDKILPPVFGGNTRQDSVLNGLKSLENQNCKSVFVHDAARPFLSLRLIDDILEALKHGHIAILPCTQPVDTVKYQQDNHFETLDRQNIYLAQTPQAFAFAPFFQAHLSGAGKNMTDDAAVMEQSGHKIHIINGEAANFKITTAEDYKKARQMTDSQPKVPHIGTGFDVHRLVSGRPLILCNIEIPHIKGLDGHSDADVALHALTDALLGTLGAGDIGTHFPPSDNQWKNANSALFLAKALELIEAANGRLINLDITILAEKPKILPYRQAMLARLSELTGLPEQCIGLKATTTEGLGFVGREEGIAAQASALVLYPERL